MGVTKQRGVPSASWRRAAGPLVSLASGVGASALSTYVYLIVVAREVGPVEYASFSFFWAVIAILGTGVFIPIENETGRRGVDAPVGHERGSLLRSAIGAAMIASAGLSVLLLASWAGVADYFGDDVLLGLALVASCLAFSVQIPVKGVLSAQRQFRWYASVLGSDALVRIALAVALVALTDASAGVLAFAIPAATLVSAAVGRLGVGPSRSSGALSLLRKAGMLIAGAAALQTLLGAPVLVARLLAPAGQEAVAGTLLAAILVVRIPVFVFQSIEGLVVPRIAELAYGGDMPRLRTVLRLVVLGVGGLAAVTTAIWSSIGPEVVALMFGADFVVTHTTMALLGLGTGVFMLAVVASDITISLRGHREMAACWVAALVVAVLSVPLIPDFELQVTLPLVIGSAVAAALLFRAARGRIAQLVPVSA
jgi:O-antigen/teichoic acid export membrane protein